MPDTRLTPRPLTRVAELVGGPGWRRLVLLRRIAAGLLALLALILALAPAPGSDGVPVVVAAADVAAGSTLRAADLAVRRWPSELVPAGALGDPSVAEGRVLVGAARTGEPLTDARLAGPSAAFGAPEDAAAVPVRLADEGVGNLLVPGSSVDVVTLGASTGEPVVLATAAAVLAVLPADPSSPGRLVLVAMPAEIAARVAAASLTDQVAITLR